MGGASRRFPFLANRGQLEPLLKPDLDAVFVGEGPVPGRYSDRTNTYYADLTNVFYRSLFMSGWTAVELWPRESEVLLQWGIGLDDVYDDAMGLIDRLRVVEPRAVCFNSRSALHQYVRQVQGQDLPPHAEWKGEYASALASFVWEPFVWALPDSSGQAAAYHPERIALLEGLRKSLRRKKAR